MNLLDKNSLAKTIDAVNEALFFGYRILETESRRVVQWLASRQGLPGSYSGMFAPTPLDFESGIRLFTGEQITSGAATSHILGEESCRAILLLGTGIVEAQAAMQSATRSMDQRLSESESERGRLGFY